MSIFIPRIEQLSHRIIRILGCNPGPFTLQGTNTYLIGTGEKRILLDAGEKGFPEYTSNLRKVLDDHKCGIQEIVITHFHHDHLGGVPDVCEKVIKDFSVKVSKYPRPGGDEDPGVGIKYTFVKDEHVFKTQGGSLVTMFTPGHADDHMCLYLEEENAVFTGDTVLGEGTTTMDDLYDFMESLHKILGRKPSILYPAHGPVVTDPCKHIHEYINHRNLRENQIIQVLTENVNQWMSAMELVKIIYKDVAENLHFAAEKNVSLHLGKLLRENKIEVSKNGAKRWKLSASL